MKIFQSTRALWWLAGSLTALASATAATLKPGDAAPPIQSTHWVQGEPVPAFDRQHVYLIEFWATWCPDCRAAIPHLNQIWQTYKDKDLIVIGQDCWERDEGGVPAFVKKMGDQLTYRVALDDKSQEPAGAMAATWMKAAGQFGIPTAFIVNRQGRIAWIGDPLTLQTNTVEQILAEQFDLAAFARKFEPQQQAEEQQHEFALKFRESLRNQNWDAADAALTAWEKSEPESEAYRFSAMRLQILLGRHDFAGACKLAESSSAAHAANAGVQNGLAWSLITSKNLDPQCLDVAEKIASRGIAITGGKDPQILDTLARAQFLVGHTNEAVATEQKAVEVAPNELKAALRKYLADYLAGKVPEAAN